MKRKPKNVHSIDIGTPGPSRTPMTISWPRSAWLRFVGSDTEVGVGDEEVDQIVVVELLDDGNKRGMTTARSAFTEVQLPQHYSLKS
jgi:hypothetical protein